jgi:hypothetical protein
MRLANLFVPTVLAIQSLICCQSPNVLYQNAVAAGAAPGNDIEKSAISGSQVFSLPYSAIAITKVAPDIENDPPDRNPGDDNKSKPSGRKGTGDDNKSNPSGKKGSGGDQQKGNGSSAQALGSAIPLGNGYGAVIVPVESNKAYRIAGVSNFWAMTTVSVERMPNTDVATSVHVTFSDLVPSRIQSFVSLATAAGHVLSPASAEQSPRQGTCVDSAEPLPFALVVNADHWSLLLGDGFSIPTTSGDSSVSCWLVHMTPVRPEYDVVTRAWFDEQIKGAGNALKAQYFPISACSTADLRIDRVLPGERYNASAQPFLTGRIKLIDPVNLRLLGLPEKGQIGMHPICGADVSNERIDRYKAYFDAASAVLDGVKPSDKATSNARKKD